LKEKGGIYREPPPGVEGNSAAKFLGDHLLAGDGLVNGIDTLAQQHDAKLALPHKEKLSRKARV